MNLTIGMKVRTSVRRPYAKGAAEVLNGQTGTVTTIREPTLTERPSSAKTGVLVTFDEPLEGWWTHQSPVTAFWFDPDEVIDITTAPKESDP